MAESIITSPDGTRYKITHPDDASYDEILQKAQEHHMSEHDLAIPPSSRTAARGAAASFLEGVPVAGPSLVKASGITDKEREEFKKYYPGQDWLAQTGGGLAATGAALALPAVGEVAAPALGAARWTGMPGNALMGTLGGAGIGGADAYARGQNPAVGAAVGAGTGMVAPIIGKGAENAYVAASDRLRPNPLPELGARARSIISPALSDLTPQSLAYARQTLGPNAFIGEATPQLQDITAGISRESGPAAAAMRQPFMDRLRGAPSRTEQAITGELGARANVPQTIEQVLQDRSAAARPLWQAAESRPFPNDPRLQELMQDPRIQAGLVRGHEDARAEALAKEVPFQPNGWRMAFNAKTGLDNLVEEQRNDFGRLSPQGRTLSMLRDAWRDRLDQINPDYRPARQAWEGPTQAVNAMKEGEKALGRGFSRDEMAEQFGNYSAGAQDAYRIGMRNNIATIMDAARRGDATARNLLLSEAGHGKISEAFGRYRAEDLRDSLEHEVGISDRTPRFVPNPNTGASLTTAPEQKALVNPQGAASRYADQFRWYDPKTYLGSSIDPSSHISAADQRANATAKQQLAPVLSSPITNDPLTDALMAVRRRQESIARQGYGVNRFITSGVAVPGGEEARKIAQ